MPALADECDKEEDEEEEEDEEGEEAAPADITYIPAEEEK